MCGLLLRARVGSLAVRNFGIVAMRGLFPAKLVCILSSNV